jgi:hypothetical protein
MKRAQRKTSTLLDRPKVKDGRVKSNIRQLVTVTNGTSRQLGKIQRENKMELLSSTLKVIDVPNKYPELKNLLITSNISVVYIHLREIPDMEYERTAEIIMGWYSLIIPKTVFRNNIISFYQSTGTDGYLGVTEVI